MFLIVLREWLTLMHLQLCTLDRFFMVSQVTGMEIPTVGIPVILINIQIPFWLIEDIITMNVAF